MDKKNIVNNMLTRYNETGVWNYKQLTEEFEKLFKESNGGYLVVSAGCTWNGCSTTHLLNYDETTSYIASSQKIEKIYRGKKTISLFATSHDVPCGYYIYVICLTMTQRENLEDWLEGDYSKARKFILKNIKEKGEL